MTATDKAHEIFGDIISSYSRKQALEDGFLVDVSATAREAGIKFPVAMTRTVWDGYVKVPDGIMAQDEMGRLWDIVYMLRVAIKRSGDGEVINYSLYVRNHNRERLDRRDEVQLKAICGPGDDPQPVITIMLPDED